MANTKKAAALRRVAAIRARWGDDWGFLPWSVQDEVATLYEQAPEEVWQAFGLVSYWDCEPDGQLDRERR